MKRLIKLLFAVLSMGILIMSCEKNDKFDSKIEITGRLINTTFCKNNYVYPLLCIMHFLILTSSSSATLRFFYCPSP